MLPVRMYITRIYCTLSHSPSTRITCGGLTCRVGRVEERGKMSGFGVETPLFGQEVFERPPYRVSSYSDGGGLDDMR